MDGWIQFDKWLVDGPLRSMIAGLLSPGEEKLRIKEVAYEGLWNFNICSIVVPIDLVLPINCFDYDLCS